jgi:hypothetical protein
VSGSYAAEHQCRAMGCPLLTLKRTFRQDEGHVRFVTIGNIKEHLMPARTDTRQSNLPETGKVSKLR